MDRLFFFDSNNEHRISYGALLNDLNKMGKIPFFVYERNTYKILLNILQSILMGKDIVLLDQNLSRSELETLGINHADLTKEEHVSPFNITSPDEIRNNLFTKISEGASNITFFSSGTTGTPKKIKQNIVALSRNLKTGNHYKENIWGLAYNPTHIAGLQVFLQAVINLNPLIDIFHLKPRDAVRVIRVFHISHLSATPTFYRLLSPNIESPILTVKSLTFGGEKYDQNLADKLQPKFPNAKHHNIYAMTEAGTLLESDGEVFSFPIGLQDAFKISPDGELLISFRFLGQSEEFTSEKQWYHTGDFVEFVNKDQFRFTNRNIETINIGGYNVNPHEVEAELRKIPGIVDALVKARKNKLTGNILKADILLLDGIDASQMEKNIYTLLRGKIQPWKIPRLIDFVEELSQTRTGKKAR